MRKVILVQWQLVKSVAVLAVFLAPSPASAATISGGVDERGHHYLSLDGSIALGDPEKLAAAGKRSQLPIRCAASQLSRRFQLANYDDRRDDGASRPVSSASFAAVHDFETI